MKPIQSIDYQVYFEDDFASLKILLEERTYSKVFILTDENTGEHCLPLFLEHLPANFSYDLIEVSAGEENKNIDFCIGIWKMLLDFGAERNSLMINLGGGVVTDMGGFAASTYKRGIDFIQIPTTLLSQVDASIGGKTGIDLDSVKNIIGTFTQPQAVFIDIEFLQTLGRRQLVSGFAEMVKHAFIFDASYFQDIKEFNFDRPDMKNIYRSVQIKNEVVCQDPKESGLRKILNFGHTVGHAVETYSLENDENSLLHGEAIAIGMICEAYLSHKYNGLNEVELQQIVKFIRNVFPDYELKSESFPALLSVMKNDKKNTNGKIGFSLLTKIGHCSFNHHLEEDKIKEALTYYQELILN